MAAITGATVGTSVADVTLTEVINRLTRYAVQTPYLWMGFCHVPPLLVGTDTYKHPYWPQLSAAAAHTETDLANVEEMQPTVPDVSTGEFSRATVVSDRAKRLATADLLAISVNRVIDACMRKIESSALTLAASMSNGQGSAATTHTALNLNSVITAFAAQAKGSKLPPVMINSLSAQRDLGADLATNGAALFGSVIGPQLHAAVTGPQQGLFRDFGGVMMASTDGVVAGDTTGKSNFIAHIGADECAIVVVFGQAPRSEYVRKGDRIADWIVGSVDFGAGTVNQSRCYRFITKA